MDNYEKKTIERPHVVILGAGASIATISNGDKNGKKISAMSGFIENLNLTEILANVQLKTQSRNLEDIYSEMHSRKEYSKECKLLEDKIYNDFSSYELPDYPTVYDHLILGLTKKDLIATFNWDPLLLQAYKRARAITEDLPELAFLHGNVAEKTCETCNIITASKNCPICGRATLPVKLLFPIKDKNYAENACIKSAWSALMRVLNTAYMVTVFGYSAPKTDHEAVSMLKKAWGKVDSHRFEQFTFIDVRNKDDVVSSWKEFVYFDHYDYCNSFYDSMIAKYPRKTCQKTFDMYMKSVFLSEENPFTEKETMQELINHVKQIL